MNRLDVIRYRHRRHLLGSAIIRGSGWWIEEHLGDWCDCYWEPGQHALGAFKHEKERSRSPSWNPTEWSRPERPPYHRTRPSKKAKVYWTHGAWSGRADRGSDLLQDQPEGSPVDEATIPQAPPPGGEEGP